MVIELPVIQGGMEIGSLDMDNGTYFVNEEAKIRYNCKMTGECCTQFQIPITDFDIKRIEEKGYALDQIVSDKPAFTRMPKTPFGSIEKNYHIKRKPFTNACTFLEEGKCSIHEFKPFSCKIFPFQFRFLDNEKVKVSIHESNFCPSVEPAESQKAQNADFLEDLLKILQSELLYRRQYCKRYGSPI